MYVSYIFNIYHARTYTFYQVMPRPGKALGDGRRQFRKEFEPILDHL